MSFARFHLLHYMSMGFMRIETTVICLAALGRVVHVLTVGFEWHCDTSLHHFVFFGMSHQYGLCYALPVKMCVTHLGVIWSLVWTGL